ncbi:hypothetical protein GCM10023189_26690 [Nibrella saemangeumensis]|uniref:Lipoprotein n=1 Tax=Nibrella saemangeumensis TaxID=1084526 RepID=A0ABP8MY29_9BACT
MKNVLMGMCLLTAGLFLSCERTAVTTEPESVTTTTARHETAKVGNDVTVSVDDIKDSRCPMNANCVWMGNATVSVTLTKGGEQVKATLCLGACSQNTSMKSRDVTTVKLGNTTYEVTLSEVKPYPVAPEPENTYKEAVITVRQK